MGCVTCPSCGVVEMLLVACVTFLVMGPSLVVADGSQFQILPRDTSLDYVSLTDHSQKEPYSDLTVKGGNQTTWNLGQTSSCSNLQPGCKCDRSGDRGWRSVICSCSDNEQVVNLKGGREQFSSSEAWSFKINGCSRVIIHQNFLSAFFDSGSKLRLLLEFQNISQMTIQEAAFNLKDSRSLSHETRVLFNKCDIETVPPKAFPSFLTSVEFTNCKIGTLSSRFIQSLKMDHIVFENSTIGSIQSDAFYSNTIIRSLMVRNSHIHQIRPHAVASGIQNLNWTDCNIDRIEKEGLEGLIANVVLERCTIGKIESLGFSVKSWSTMIISNNTFENVSYRGIDLTFLEPKSELEQPAQIIGNVWHHLDRDFVISGGTDRPFALVRNNTFLGICSCGTTFAALLTLDGSQEWFHEEFFQASRCPMDEKGRRCFQFTNSSGSVDGFVAYNELSLLCSTEMFMCLSEVKDMQVNPQLPNRLQMVAFLIGAFVLFMVVSLLLTCLVYMIRRKPRKQDGENPTNELTNDLPRKEFVKSLNDDPYGVINHKIPKTPSMPTRIALLEDVEMEDKGVQTLPTELSADIIEGLREKLSKPDSFWDAKETIDHLYDLIHVRDQSVSTSSPPDVTVRNDSDTQTQTSNCSNKSQNLSSDSLKLLVSPSKRPRVLPLDKSPRRTMSTFTQLPSSSKVTTPVCDYGNPKDLQSHIYAELAARNGKISNESPQSPNPHLCEYTEPRDFQTHIYAELFSNGGSPSRNNYGQTTANQFLDIPSTSCNEIAKETPNSVIAPSSPQNRLCSTNTSTLNDLNSDTASNKAFTYGISKVALLNPPDSTSNFSDANNINIPNTQTNLKRPLPSIPSVSSNVQ